MDVPETLIAPTRHAAFSHVSTPGQDGDAASLRGLIVAKLTYAIGRDPAAATERDWTLRATWRAG